MARRRRQRQKKAPTEEGAGVFSVKPWLRRQYIKSSKDPTPIATLYNRYRAEAKRAGKQPLSMKGFVGQLDKIGIVTVRENANVRKKPKAQIQDDVFDEAQYEKEVKEEWKRGDEEREKLNEEDEKKEKRRRRRKQPKLEDFGVDHVNELIDGYEFDEANIVETAGRQFVIPEDSTILLLLVSVSQQASLKIACDESHFSFAMAQRAIQCARRFVDSGDVSVPSWIVWFGLLLMSARTIPIKHIGRNMMMNDTATAMSGIWSTYMRQYRDDEELLLDPSEEQQRSRDALMGMEVIDDVPITVYDEDGSVAYTNQSDSDADN